LQIKGVKGKGHDTWINLKTKHVLALGKSMESGDRICHIELSAVPLTDAEDI